MPLDDRGCNGGRPRFWRAALLLSLAATVSALAHDRARAQPGFPTKPIHIFIPYGAGGVADLTMRLLAPSSDPQADGLGEHPPPRPPRFLVRSA